MLRTLALLIALTLVLPAAHGQQGTPAPVPEGPQAENPCQVLLQELHRCANQVTAWTNLVEQKTKQVAAAKRHLETLEDIYRLMLIIASVQEGPLTEGQREAQRLQVEAIQRQRVYIAEITSILVSCQQELVGWKQSLQRAQQAWAASGCR